MNYFFITGVSKGLGKALLELLLKEENNFVYGYSRTCATKHSRFKHTVIDLSDLSKVKILAFPQLSNPESIAFINNAGMVGDINHVGSLDNQKIIESYNLNIISPVILTNNFISKYNDLTCEITILNISSGAGRKPIDGWSVYCSSKSALDMFSLVLDQELRIDNSNIKVLSLAPGIIDTDMQDQIRKADRLGFSNLERFIKYKEDEELVDPSTAAHKVLRYLKENNLQRDVICTVRDL